MISLKKHLGRIGVTAVKLIKLFLHSVRKNFGAIRDIFNKIDFLVKIC